MSERKNLFVNWKSLNGAAQGRRILKLRPNQNGSYTCPVRLCLHADFKSQRGLRKHIDSKHSWYYYFEEQPEVKREEIINDQPPVAKKSSTKYKPFYSIENGIGKSFLDWLTSTCGGGKTEREAKQIGKRGMKFLMECTGDNDSTLPLSKDFLDCCLGSPQIIIQFLTLLENEWKLSYSSSLSYVRAINDLLDFRKSEGVTDSSLRCFTVTEVYLRRARENLSKKKNMECTRNYDLETLIARDSWATMEEMEEVIPYHISQFKTVIEKCKIQSPLPTKQELTFCTRFMATFLFLRVKCSRPMTFQFLTIEMIERAKDNGGFIDQTQFKTAGKYLFDTLVMTPEVLTVIKSYSDHARPLLKPKSNYLLVSITGTQFQSLTNAMTMLVHQAIGKYINPTRYRQIVETTSADRLSREDQETISEDQKHCSTVAKIYYKKKKSRTVAIQGKECMDKMIGDVRKKPSNNLSSVLSELETLNKSIRASEKSSEIATSRNDTRNNYSSSTLSRPLTNVICAQLPSSQTNNMSNDLESDYNPFLPIEIPDDRSDEITIVDTVQAIIGSSGTINQDNANSCCNEFSTDVLNKLEISNSVTVKKECAEKQLNKNVKFTTKEDDYLISAIIKYGRKSWSRILKDKQFQFHDSRTRDSLRIARRGCSIQKTIKTAWNFK